MEFNLRPIYFVSVFIVTFMELTDVNALVSDDSYCYKQDRSPYRNFGTSTSYQLFFESQDTRIGTAEGCAPVYAYGVMRVGARYYKGYNAGHLKRLQGEILENHGIHKRGELCMDELTLLESWKDIGREKNSDVIAKQGILESADLGKSFGRKFRRFGADKPSDFHFFITSNPTSQDTANAFAKGMFGDAAAKVPISLNEDVLRFIENSEDFEEKSTKPALQLRDECLNSDVMKMLNSEVTVRLGFSKLLKTQPIEDMYFSCVFETAWNPDQRPGFCVAFSKRHLQILEYCYMDVLGYYEWGYGAQYALEAHSPILDDMLKKMEPTSHSNNRGGDFNFTSAAGLTHTITKLGLYRDEGHMPVEPSNYAFLKLTQKWSMTRICPFNGNLLLILHKCEEDEPKVSLLHNERPITIPGCSDEFCPWSSFQKIIQLNNSVHH